MNKIICCKLKSEFGGALNVDGARETHTETHTERYTEKHVNE